MKLRNLQTKRHRRKHALSRAPYAMLSAVVILSVIAVLGLVLPKETQAVYSLYERSYKIGDNNYLRPYGDKIAHDSHGNFYIIAQSGSPTYTWIQKFSPDNELLTQWRPYAGVEPAGIVVDSDDNVWASFRSRHIIVKYSPSGERLLIVGTPNASSTEDGRFNQPAHLAADASGGVFVSDYLNNRIQKFNTAGQWQWTTGGPAIGSGDGQFNQPTYVATDSEGSLFVADSENNRIQKLSSSGEFMLKFGQINTPGPLCPVHPSLDSIDGMTVDVSTDTVYVATQQIWCSSLYKFDGDSGSYIERSDTRAEPVSMHNGVLYGAHYSDSALSSFDTNGVRIDRLVDRNPVGQIRGDFKGLAEDSEGNVYLIDGSNRVFKFDDSGNFVSILINQGTAPELVNTPVGIAIDSDDNIYVADSNRYTVKKYDKDGTYITNFGSQGSGDAQFNSVVRHVAVDSGGDIYIASANTIKRFSADGSFLSTRLLNKTYMSINYMSVNSSDELNLVYTYRTGGRLQTNILKVASDGTDLGDFYINYAHDYGRASMDRYDNIWLHDDSAIGPLNEDSRELRNHTTSSQIFANDGSGSIIGKAPAGDEGVDPPSRDTFFYISPKSDRMYVSGYFNFIQVLEPTALVSPPSAPRNVVAEADGPSKMQISWDEPAQTGNDPNTTYTVQYRPHRYGEWITAKIDISEHQFTLTKLLDDTYDVRVIAVNSAGEGPSASDADIVVTASYALKESRVLEQFDRGGLETGVVDEDGIMYTFDSWNTGKIYVQSADGTLLYDFGGWDVFSYVRDIIIGPDDRLYIADGSNAKIIVANKDGTIERSFGDYGIGPGLLIQPSHISYDKQSNTLLITNRYRSVQRFTLDGTYIETIAGELLHPTATAIDSKGNIFIANSSNNEYAGIYKYAPDGETLIKVFASSNTPEEFEEIFDMVAGTDDSIVVSDVWNYRILAFDNDGNPTGEFGYAYWDSGVDELDGYMSLSEASGMSVSPDGTIYLYNNYDPAKYIAIVPTGLVTEVPELPTDPEPTPDPEPKPDPKPAPKPDPKPDSTKSDDAHQPPSRPTTPTSTEPLSPPLAMNADADSGEQPSDDRGVSVTATPNPEEGLIYVSWQQPSGPVPDGYVVERYDESAGEWRELASVAGAEQSASIYLDPGEYRLRVTALVGAGERRTLGVATATLTKPVQGSASASQPEELNDDAADKSGGATLTAGAIVATLTALVAVLIIVWRRRRRQNSDVGSRTPRGPSL